MKVKRIDVGSVSNIFIGRNEQDFDAEAKRIIDKGHADGKSVTVKGVKTHHHFEAIVDLNKSGADQYTWDKSGDRVKGNIVEYTNQKDGSVTKRTVRTTYRSYE